MGGAWPGSIICVRVENLQGTGSAGDDGVGLFLPALGLALELRDGSLVIAGLGVGPVRTGHALLCHGITSMFVFKTVA